MSCLSGWAPSEGNTRLVKVSLENGCGLFSWKFFFQTQQQGHEQAEEPLSACDIVHLMPADANALWRHWTIYITCLELIS
ncbi:hypothetical protein TNCV_3760311 [Trichonephila clavipes]|nr:hypothetical protein TNCV_3760311 [Trichonephila clavipes]